MLPVCVCVIDRNTGKIIAVNRAAAALIGYSKKSIIGNDNSAFFDSDGKGAVNEETILTGAAGARIPVLLTAVPLKTGGRNCLIESFTDISARRQAHRLLEIQRDLGALLGSVTDIQKALHQVLDACMQIGGIDAGGLYLIDNDTGDLYLVVHKGFAPAYIDAISFLDRESPQKRLVNRGRPLYARRGSAAFSVLAGAGVKEKITAIGAVPIQYEGRVIALLTIASHAAPAFPQGARNFVESIASMAGGAIARIKTDKERKKNEVFLQSIFRAAPIGIGIVRHRILGWTNAMIHTMTGYSEDELRGKSARLLYPNDEEFERVGRDKYLQIERGGIGTVETKWVRKNGTVIEVLLSSTPIDLSDRDSDVTFIAYDITGRKQLESQLRHSEKMEAIGQLAGGIAHDFNNQLQAVLGYADLIRLKASSDPALVRFADNIIMSARRGSDLTKQLLAFARKGKYLSVPVNLHSIINEVVTLLQHSIDKKIAVKQQLRAGPPMTRGDPGQLQNALLNLALNARDAISGSGEIRFGTSNVQLDETFCKNNLLSIAPGRYVEITIADTGIGMSKEVIKHIFEPFFTTKEPGKGTGMGLPAVYGTMRNHNGAITVKSRVGAGSTFKVYLPQNEAYEPAEETVIPQAPVREQACTPRRIMIVDDEDLVLSMGVDLLQSLGHTVTACRNGHEAVDRYREAWKEIDLVILDIIMPEIDGMETYQLLKTINPAAKVLLSSGYSLEGKAKAIIARGANGFLPKPFNIEDIQKKICELVKG